MPDVSHEEKQVRAKASRLLSLSKYRAKRRGIEHTIDREWVLDKLREGTCSFSGLPFSYDRHPVYRVNPFSPSIHRKDSSQGYTPENSTIVCSGVNSAVNCMTTQEFLLLSMAVLKKHQLA